LTPLWLDLLATLVGYIVTGGLIVLPVLLDALKD